MIKSFVSSILIKNNIPIIKEKEFYILYTAAFGSGYSFENFQKIKFKYKIFIFTDQKKFLKLNNKKFHVYLINSKLKKSLLNRIFKFLPHKIFPNVENTTYFDSKKFPNKNINFQEKIFNLNTDILISKFNLSYSCIYAHYDDLIKKKIINKDKIFENLMKHYKKVEFPKNFGMVDTCIIFRKKNNDVNFMFEKILYFIIKLNVHRDQLLFMFFLWRGKNKFDFKSFNFDYDFDISKNSRVKMVLFKRLYHFDRESIAFRIVNKLTFRLLEKLIV